MTWVLARLLNVRYIGSRRLRSALTVAGIASGVALMFSISVINTTLLESFRQGLRVVAGEAELELASAGPTGLRAGLEEEIEQIAGVDRAVPVLRSTTTFVTGTSEEELAVLGVTPEFLSLFPRRSALGTVSLQGGVGGGGIALARQTADALGIGIGERALVQTPEGPRPVPVSGILNGGALRAVNAGAIGVMGLGDAQRIFGRGRYVDSFYIVVDEQSPVEDVSAALDARFGDIAIAGPPGERGRGLERVFGGIGTLLSLSGTVSLFVALFVVFNTMSMAVVERRRDLSMALALGAGPRSLFRAFIAEAALLGIVASIAGLALGRLLAEVLVDIAAEGYSVLPISTGGPVVVRSSHLITAFAGGLAVSMAGAILPARRVLAMSPVEALRPVASYESSVNVWRGRRIIVAGSVAVACAIPMFWAFVVTGQRWIATLGLIVALTGITLVLPSIVPIGLRVVRRVVVPFMGTEGRLAADTLERNPGRTTFTAAALILTLGLVLGVASALSSYHSEVEETAGALVGAPIYVVAESFAGLSSDQPLQVALGRDLEEVEGVSFVYPVRFAYINVEGEQTLLYAVPGQEAVDAGMTSRFTSITDDPRAFLDGLARGDIAISDLMADDSGLQVGDNVDLPTASGQRSFRVAAIFEDLVSFNSVYIHHDVYAAAWEDDKADEFGVLLDEDADPEAVMSRLEETLRAEGAPAKVLSKDDLLGQLLELVEGSFSLGRAIQFSALIVALLTIANTMFTSVLERRWEHGLQRALGMSRAQVARGVMIESAFLGLVGAAGGVVVGLASGWLMTRAMEVQFDWSIGFELPAVETLLVAAAGLGVAVVAGALPSRLAVRPSVVESLRFE